MANAFVKNTSKSQQNRIEPIVGYDIGAAQQHQEELLTTDVLLSRMKQVDEAINEAKFTTQLGAQIFDICTALRHRGIEFEERHKSELDKFFTAIRQAVCREGGELGLPCRLKVLELLELRLLGWRNSLSHAQYYSKRDRQLDSQSAPNPSTLPMVAAPHPCKEQRKEGIVVSSSTSSALLRQTQSPSNPMLPPFLPFSVPPPAPQPPCLLGSPDFPTQIPSTGYFFIPSRTANPFIPAMPTNFAVTQGAALYGGIQAPSSPLPASLFGTQKMSPNAKSFAPRLLEGIADPIGGMIGKAKAAQQQQQFREEMTIRNSDSGKVMGVKGRRVALIEAISKTVISFQKVDPKCKERLLTIIADTADAIECAKRLIADTIERNVSPERPNDLLEKESILGKPQLPTVQATVNDSIRVIQEADGSVRITSDNPSILEAAQTALREHLKNAIVFGGTNNGEIIQQASSNGSPHQQKGGENRRANAKGTSLPLVYDRNTLLMLRQNSLEETFLMESRKKLEKLDIFIGGKHPNELMQ